MDVIAEGDRNSADRLSDMPDSVLISILSFLKPMEFVQTCILSKRWLHLWASVPCLDFDGTDFWEWQYEPVFEPIRDGKVIEKFNNFVTNVLLRRNDTMDVHTIHFKPRFHNVSKPEMSSLFRAATLYAVDRNLKNLYLDTMNTTPVGLPDRLFTCQSLEELHLHSHPGWDTFTVEPPTVRLPRLRKLELLGAKSYANHFEKLLSGSPVLESLEIMKCDLEMNIFASQSLRRLKVSDVTFIARSVPLALSICAPAVENLKFFFHGKVKRGIAITLREMPKLVWANVTVWSFRKLGRSFNLLSGLPNVVDLKIQCFYLQDVLGGKLAKCPTFYNLKKLNLNICCMCCSFDEWYTIVKRCPNLEALTLKHSEKKCEGPDAHSIEEKIQNLEQMKEGLPLSSVQIMYQPLDDTVHDLVRLVMAVTRNLRRARIILTNAWHELE